MDWLTSNWYWGAGVAIVVAAWWAWRKWKRRGR